MWRCKGAAKEANPSWSPNPSRAEIQFGFQEQSAPKLSPRSHTNSVLYVLYMDGKIRGSTFQWNWYHIQITSESTRNVETMRCTESVTISWPRGLCIKLGPIGARPRVRARPSPHPGHPLPLSYTPIDTTNRLGFVVLLRPATHRWLNCPSPASKTPNYVYSDWSEFSHLQFSCLLSCSCLFFDCL
jgi:hypothetical protein